MKIYTKTGDDGSTGLIGGTRVSKSDPRLECYGTVDELNAAIGLAMVAAGAAPAAGQIVEQLRAVQNELFVIGSRLATPDGVTPPSLTLPALADSAVTRLEQQIDAADSVLPKLTNFILPGGSEIAARLHLARTVCRRAERHLVALSADRSIDKLIRYVNRLSDWLFVQARLANHLAGITDVPWLP